MFLVDERIGSKDLLQPLQRLGVPAELQRLEYGDFAFIGRGIENADVYIGVELKETRDLASCVRTKRFAGHQLIGLQSYDRAWLVTEGIWRANDDGTWESMSGGWRDVQPRMMMADVESWLLSQIIRGGMSYWHCPTRRDTIRFLATLYHWWTDKSLEEHRSHQAIYQAPPDRASLVAPSAFVKGLVGLVDKVGYEKALAVESACGGSFNRLGHMTARTLQDVPGIGPKLSTKIVSALEGQS